MKSYHTSNHRSLFLSKENFFIFSSTTFTNTNSYQNFVHILSREHVLILDKEKLEFLFIDKLIGKWSLPNGFSLIFQTYSISKDLTMNKSGALTYALLAKILVPEPSFRNVCRK